MRRDAMVSMKMKINHATGADMISEMASDRFFGLVLAMILASALVLNAVSY